MLLRASDRRVRYLRGGMFTILSMQFEEIDSLSTLVSVLKAAVYNLSMGGF